MSDGSHRAQDGGGVDQDVEAAEAVVQGQAQLVQAIALGDIHRDQGGRLAGDGADLIVEFGQGAFGACDGDDVRAGLGEGKGGFAADPAACAGDEGDLAGEGRVRSVGHGAVS